MLSACSSSVNEPEIDTSAGIIAFTAEASRADDSQPAIDAFDVWATRHDPDGTVELATIFNATTVSYDNDTKAWTYSGGDRYWLPGLAFNFRALYPAGLSRVTFNSANGENSALTVSEIVPTETPSFMAATDRREISPTTTTQPVVQLTFHQLLSRISFRGSSNEQQLGVDRRVILEYAAVYGIADRGSWSSEGFKPADGNLGTWTPSAPTGSSEQPLFKVDYPDG
ncbi:MAG: fimbrillin family protein, partial [Roseburia sp.]|nr:fimbrillin family protein [Roseburia sp.]